MFPGHPHASLFSCPPGRRIWRLGSEHHYGCVGAVDRSFPFFWSCLLLQVGVSRKQTLRRALAWRVFFGSAGGSVLTERGGSRRDPGSGRGGNRDSRRPSTGLTSGLGARERRVELQSRPCSFASLPSSPGQPKSSASCQKSLKAFVYTRSSVHFSLRAALLDPRGCSRLDWGLVGLLWSWLSFHCPPGPQGFPLYRGSGHCASLLDTVSLYPRLRLSSRGPCCTSASDSHRKYGCGLHTF